MDVYLPGMAHAVVEFVATPLVKLHGMLTAHYEMSKDTFGDLLTAAGVVFIVWMMVAAVRSIRREKRAAIKAREDGIRDAFARSGL